MSKAIQHGIEYFFVKLLISILNLLPLSISIRFGDFIAFVAYKILGIRKQVTLTNLRRTFGNKYTDKEYNEIGYRSYVQFARSMIEFGLYPKLKKIGLDKIAKIANPEKVDEHLKTGKGAILIGGHFGNLELVGAVLTMKDWPVDFLVGKQSNKMVNALMNRHRALFGVGIIEVGVSARGVIRVLRKGRWIAFLSDQDARKDGTIVDFLGRPASTPKGAAAFSLICKCPIFLGAFVREGLNHHTLYFKGPFYIEKSDDKEKDIQRLTQMYTDALAEFVYEYPDHYFWMHKRWKTTCPEDYQKK